MHRLVQAAVLVACAAPAVAPGAGLRDTSGRRPPDVALPAAGGSYVDPVFGTKILRVTDASDGAHCVHAYSYWPAFNADSTRLLLACDGVPLLYRFDPLTGALAADGPLAGADGPAVQFEGASWSSSAPEVIYALDAGGTKLWRLDVARRGAAGATVVKDFAGLLPAGEAAYQLAVSQDGRVFTFHTRDASGARREALAWEPATDRLHLFPRPAGRVVDETKVDELGRFVMVSWSDGDVTLWDFRGGATRWLDHATPADNAGGHFDLGADYVVSSDQVMTGLVVRGYEWWEAPQNVVTYRRGDGSLNWSIADHVSLRVDGDAFVVASTYGGDGAWDAFEDEIYLAYTDGSGFVRLAHTRSTGGDYWSQPRATVDRSGRFVVYTSDLGDGARHDVMILVVPPELIPDPVRGVLPISALAVP